MVHLFHRKNHIAFCGAISMVRIIDIRLNKSSYSLSARLIVDWGKKLESRYVCACNVHMIMEAHDNPSFREVVNKADIVTPDGMPLVWMMRLKGVRRQQRVYGPTLMLHVLELCEKESIPIGLLGSTSDVLELLREKLIMRYPQLKINYSYSPPFGDLSEDENDHIVSNFNQSGSKILFVGLGCPKQEIWMSKNKGRIKAVMIGVGAAFDFHAGVKPQSPPFLQKLGLEWLFRLFHEPKRLWKRYLYNNPRFIILAIADLLGLYHTATMK